jgi:hypothetical protein
MIKRHDIRPRRKRTGSGGGSDTGGSTPGDQESAEPIEGPLTPTGTFDDK